MVSTAVWIPLILYFYEGAAESGRRTGYVLAGAALGAQILAGEPQNTYYTLLIVAVYGAVRLGRRWRAALSWLASFAGVVGVALLVAAAQVLPTAEMLQHSDRRTTTYAFATAASFPPSSLVGLLLPWSPSTQFLVAGNPARAVVELNWEYALYPGVLTLVLALAALGRRRPSPLVAAQVLLLGGLVLMLGGHTPLYRLLFTIMPGLRLFRVPSRAVVIVAWSLCVLAAYGLQFVIQERPLPWRGRWRTAAVAMVAATGAAWAATSLGSVQRLLPATGGRETGIVRGTLVPITLTDGYGARPLVWLALAGAFVVALPRLRPRAAAAGAIGLLSADLVLSQPPFPLSGDDAPRRATVRALQALRETVPGELFRVDLAPRHVDALAALGARVENVNGYWPLALGRFYHFAHAMRGMDDRVFFSRHQLYDVLYERADPFAVPLLNVLFATRTPGPEKVELVRARHPFPRAWVVGEAEVVPGGEAALARLLDPTFDARSVVVLEEPPAAALRAGPPPGHAVARRVDDAELAVDTDTSTPGYLVLSELHYPGWHAAVDGRPVRLQRADYVLTALPLPEGRHHVRYWYDPLSARLGLLVSAVSLVGVLGVAVRGRLRAKLDYDGGSWSPRPSSP